MIQDFAKYRRCGAYHWARTHGAWWKRSPLLEALYHFAVSGVARHHTLENRLGLDVGCGDGVMVDRFLHLGARVVGLDSQPEALELARKLTSVGRNAVMWVRADAHNLPFSDNTFDFVTCIEVIEHLNKADLCIAEVRRILKPGGVFVVTTPEASSERGVRDAFHVHEFTSGELSGLLSEFFEYVTVKSAFPFFWERLYLRATGVLPLDIVVRNAIRLAARLGMNPFLLTAGKRPERCLQIIGLARRTTTIPSTEPPAPRFR